MEPREGGVLDAVPGGESFKKDGVVDGVKCCREVEETKAGNLFVADGTDDGVMDGEKDGFSTVERGVGRLERVGKWVAAEMFGKVDLDDPFDEFRDKGQV